MFSIPRLRENIFLIGDINTEIYGNKLPSNSQVLKVLFFNIRHIKLSVRESSILAVKEVLVFLHKAHLPTQHQPRCVKKLKKLYNEWRSLQKSAGNPHNIEKEQKFKSMLQNLFDIAHGEIDGMIDETRRESLTDQRTDGRIEYIGDIETIYDAIEKAQLDLDDILSARLRKNQMEKESLGEVVELVSSGEASGATMSQNSIGAYSNVCTDDFESPGPSQPKRSRGNTHVVNEKLVAVLDTCKISDRKAVHLIIATAQALNHDVNSLIVNKTSIGRCRETLREAKAKNIKEIFKTNDLETIILHWNGKLLQNMLKREVLDILPIVLPT